MRLLPLLILALFMPVAAAAARPIDAMHAPIPPGYYVSQKVVYQNDGGPDGPAYFGRLLHNLENHIQAVGGDVRIKVVSFGPGVQLFQLAKTTPELAGALDRLRKAGVRFLVCRNTLQAMHLTPTDLYGVTDGDLVPSGVAEVARLQGQGYVYEHP